MRLACALCEEFKDKNAPRAFMGKFGLGNVLGVDADARQLVEVAVVPLTAHIGAIYGGATFTRNWDPHGLQKGVYGFIYATFALIPVAPITVLQPGSQWSCRVDAHAFF